MNSSKLEMRLNGSQQFDFNQAKVTLLKTVSLVLSVSTVTALLEMGGIMGGLVLFAPQQFGTRCLSAALMMRDIFR